MGTISPFPNKPPQIAFDRPELTRILDLYGRMVAAGLWRDYAIDLGRDAACFAAFRRAAERPEYRIEKRPALRHRQGIWSLIGEGGASQNETKGQRCGAETGDGLEDDAGHPGASAGEM